jgi:hypothetical protein
VMNGFSFSLLGSSSTTRLFARVDAAGDSIVLRVRFPKSVVSAIALSARSAAFFLASAGW